MKKLFYFLTVAVLIYTSNSYSQSNKNNRVQAAIDLNKINDDKVTVIITPPKFTEKEIFFNIPKTVPGTYSEDNYGKFIENFQVFDKKGKKMVAVNISQNSWSIQNPKKISKITYEVNDTFETEIGKGYGDGDVFSPAGSNIDAGKNILLNTHCFIGYFTNYMTTPYQLTIKHPESLWGATSMTDIDKSNTGDIFETSKYAELVENPIMYSKPDFTTFEISGMEILLAVYSPHGMHSAESLTPAIKKMMTAQKSFLGSINSTKKYSILLYLSDISNNYDAKGYGALEHPTATTVVMPEAMDKDALLEELKDVVSHEFFHILTPLTIHSKEIQYFDYINPKMSEHLWMYEGVTEYFANLFQVNQGLISEDDFYKRMNEKMENAAQMNDTMPFTTMSANVFIEPYKDQYLNVYQKGSLIGMCLDIIIREKSDGKKGILNLMKELSNEYGINKPFDDKDLFAKITQLTYPEVWTFLTTYVSGDKPIPYDFYLEKMGVTKTIVKIPGSIFVDNETSYVTINPSTKEVIAQADVEKNIFYTTLGIKANDIILAINNTNYNSDNVYDLIIASQIWKENDLITVKIKRNGKEQTLKGNIKLPYREIEEYHATDANKKTLREAWLKG